MKAIVKKLQLEDIAVYDLPPYVALVDSTVWEVKSYEKLKPLCTKKENFAMQLLLQHKESGIDLRAVNCHIPSMGRNKAPEGRNRQKAMQHLHR